MSSTGEMIHPAAPPTEFVIRPTAGWFDVHLGEVWRYRDLLMLFVYRDFIARYTQTILGPAWFVIQPVLTTLVFLVVFTNIAGIPTDEVPPMLFYLCGLLGWNYFATTFGSVSSTFLANASVFGKVYFPRLVVPLSAVLSGFIAFAVQLATFAAFWVFFKAFTAAAPTFHLSATVVAFPLVLLHIAALSLGVGLWLSALTTKYRDFTHLTPLLIQLWMYATPVIYPLSRIPDRWRWVAAINPMSVPVEATRLMLLGRGTVDPLHLAISIGVTLVILCSGVVVFSKVEKTSVDTI